MSTPEQQSPSDGPLLIIADTYQMAREYARENDLGPERRGWRYITDLSQVLGVRPGRYVTLSAGGATGLALAERIRVGEHLRMVGFTYGRGGA